MPTKDFDAPPRVFLCYAGEDLEFAQDLARRLNGDSLLGFFGQWDLATGDQFVDRIFEQEIPASEVFVIVVSPHSKAKPFPKAELEFAWLQRQKRNIRILPIRLDQVDAPNILAGTYFMDASRPTITDVQYEKLRSDIYNTKTRPVSGPTPKRFVPPQTIGDYTIEETRVLAFLIERVPRFHLLRRDAFERGLSMLDARTITAALDTLEEDGLVTVHNCLQGPDGWGFTSVSVKPATWMQHAEMVLGISTAEDAERVRAAIMSLQGDRATIDINELAAVAALPDEPAGKVDAAIVRFGMVLEDFETLGYITVDTSWVMLTQTGRRRLRQAPRSAGR